MEQPFVLDRYQLGLLLQTELPVDVSGGDAPVGHLLLLGCHYHRHQNLDDGVGEFAWKIQRKSRINVVYKILQHLSMLLCCMSKM